MFWSGSGAFIRRHVATGDAQYFDWRVSVSSRRDASGRRRLDLLHLSCARHPLGPSDETPMAGFEISVTVRDRGGADGATDRLLCLRASARAIDLWIAAAGPEHAPLPDGGTIILDGTAEVWHG
ncbi:hypothetical protein [Inquilinus limosus]|uniref:Uncharacterized protein n=1 Tax=Inquilinus limosus MP06 TaxID=1398085 RepID=A0A0A0D9U1_9PROT|nr:hypothetical protein [Inquilinus limosus]KGM35496.1 hypothetical protein P409_04155 [Inquilinus limosus MP06]